MKLGNLLLCSLMAFLFTSCWIGDQDDPEILYDTTLIEQLCQTPEISLFCEMIYLTSPVQTGVSLGLVPNVAWRLQFAGRAGIVLGQHGQTACPTDIETVFAPTNEAVQAFLDDYPQWNSIYDIPMDSMDILTKHHIYRGGKLKTPNGTRECTEVTIIGGPRYQMWVGYWIFLTNIEGEFIALSEFGDQTTTPIVSPDLSSTDGAVYIVVDVLDPFN